MIPDEEWSGKIHDYFRLQLYVVCCAQYTPRPTRSSVHLNLESLWNSSLWREIREPVEEDTRIRKPEERGRRREDIPQTKIEKHKKTPRIRSPTCLISTTTLMWSNWSIYWAGTPPHRRFCHRPPAGCCCAPWLSSIFFFKTPTMWSSTGSHPHLSPHFTRYRFRL